MKRTGFTILFFTLLFVSFQSCKKTTVQVVDFSAYTATNNKCEVTGTPDTTEWINSVLTRQTDSSLLTFYSNVVTTDTLTGPITVSPPCPNPSSGFFIWNVSTTRQCKLLVVCTNTNYDILYFNSYALNGGPITLGFDFRSLTAFKPNTNYRMFYGFYNANDSLYYSGHGDIRLQ